MKQITFFIVFSFVLSACVSSSTKKGTDPLQGASLSIKGKVELRKIDVRKMLNTIDEESTALIPLDSPDHSKCGNGQCEVTFRVELRASDPKVSIPADPQETSMTIRLSKQSLAQLLAEMRKPNPNSPKLVAETRAKVNCESQKCRLDFDFPLEAPKLQTTQD